MGRSISKKTRFEVFKRDKFTCQYCGQAAPDVVLEVDHIVSVAEGGDNDIMNLVTACFDCNRGKGKTQLSDLSKAKLQKAQLDLLQERRDQLELMHQWKQELLDYELDGVEKLNELINELTGYEVTEHGQKKLLNLIHQFSLQEVWDAVIISFTQYETDSDSGWEYAFSKIGGICYNRRKQVQNA